MKKISGIILGAYLALSSQLSYAVDKFDILPDLPEPLASAAQASSVTVTDSALPAATQTVGQEPNFLSMIFSLIFVVLLIYATGVVYAKLNKFGERTLKRQVGDASDSKVSVISTTPLGANKTLHVVELGGKRMLIGASASSIHLIKDLGNYPHCEIEEGEFSKIEIPNIRIPKIEIPKIEIPGFTKVVSSKKSEEIMSEDTMTTTEHKTQKENDEFEFTEIYEEENPDGIIDKLFHTTPEVTAPQEKLEVEHKVDPDEFALYKKYL